MVIQYLKTKKEFRRKNYDRWYTTEYSIKRVLLPSSKSSSMLLYTVMSCIIMMLSYRRIGAGIAIAAMMMIIVVYGVTINIIWHYSADSGGRGTRTAAAADALRPVGGCILVVGDTVMARRGRRLRRQRRRTTSRRRHTSLQQRSRRDGSRTNVWRPPCRFYCVMIMMLSSCLGSTFKGWRSVAICLFCSTLWRKRTRGPVSMHQRIRCNKREGCAKKIFAPVQ